MQGQTDLPPKFREFIDKVPAMPIPPLAKKFEHKEPDQRPQRKGWAPGEYSCTCRLCLTPFIGDKRAGMCADCAYADALEDLTHSKRFMDAARRAFGVEQPEPQVAGKGPLEGWTKEEIQAAQAAVYGLATFDPALDKYEVKPYELPTGRAAERSALAALIAFGNSMVKDLEDLPKSRELSLAITKFQEGVMWLRVAHSKLSPPHETSGLAQTPKQD